MQPPDHEDAAIADATRRSLAETTREEALLADMLRASVLFHDENIACAFQSQIDLEDRARG